MMRLSAARRRSGFTLIELMLAVAIIGILASTALPSYQRYVMRSKQVEGYTMMTVIKNQQFTHLAHYDCFAAAAANPPGPITSVRRPWNEAALINERCPGPAGSPTAKAFEDISVRPLVKLVYYQYSCSATYGGPGTDHNFACCAEGDLDGDGLHFQMVYGSDEDGDGQTLPTCSSGVVSNFPLDPVRVSPGIF